MKSNKAKWGLLCIAILSGISLALLVLQIFRSNPNIPPLAPYIPTDSTYEGTVYGVSVSSTSSSSQNLEKNQIVLSNVDEPLNIFFGQQGKTRTMALRIYYDYIPIKFKIGKSGSYTDLYTFSLDSNTGMNFDLYLDSALPIDDSSHSLIVDFVSGYSAYAKDMETLTSNYGSTEAFWLSFLKRNKEPSSFSFNSLYPLEQALSYIPTTFDGIILNTKPQEIKKIDTIEYPEKLYCVEPSVKFNMNYYLSDMDPSANDALIFLTVGHEPTDIDKQKYKWIDLRKNRTAVGALSFTTPEVPGTYDVIGYVVYNPFEANGDVVHCFPRNSVRFSIEVQSTDINP